MNIEVLINIFDTLSRYEKMIGRTFPSIAFHKVSNQIKASSEIEVNGELVYVDGVKLGWSSSQIIIEYLTKGYSTRFNEAYDYIKTSDMDISSVAGIGEVKSDILKSKGINSVYDLEKLNLKVGDQILDTNIKFNEMMEAGLKMSLLTENKRLSYNEAVNLSELVKTKLLDVNKSLDITIAGSLRRNKSTIGDLDFIVIVNDDNRFEIVNQCKTIYDQLIISGDKKISGVVNNFQVDIRFILKKEYGCHLLHATGSAEFNQRLRAYAKSKNLKLNEYCITDLSDNSLHYFTSEEAVFNYLGVQYVRPEGR